MVEAVLVFPGKNVQERSLGSGTHYDVRIAYPYKIH